jgi:SAM-dependent methyltransferase
MGLPFTAKMRYAITCVDGGPPSRSRGDGASIVTFAYERYYASGRYDERYPQPNPVVIRTIRRWSPVAAPAVIDFGCGSGRYALALAGRSRNVVGYDICSAALSRAADHRSAQGNPSNVHFGEAGAFSARVHLDRHGPADVALAIFGVLAHIPEDDARRGVLAELRRALQPGTGRLVISVPNRRRRFRAEQAANPADPTRIVYERALPDANIELFYRLYDPAMLRAELRAAGFNVLTVMAESLLPERTVANSAAARTLERLVTPAMPAGAGYGLLAVAQRPADDHEADA